MEKVFDAKNCTAKILRETEKALMLQYSCEIYGEQKWFKVWMPKSQLEEISRDGDKLNFNTFQWILTTKVREEIRKIENEGYCICEEFKMFLKNICGDDKINFCFA